MPLRSMTGFGRASREAAGLAVAVEVRAVNGRHLSLRCRVPGEHADLEPRLEAAVRKVVRRGAVDLTLRLDGGAGRPVPRIDRRALDVYRGALTELGLEGGTELLRLPGVVTMEEPGHPPKRVERLARAALDEALEALDAARLAEGQRLSRALSRELKALTRHVAAVRRRAPRVVAERGAALRQRLERLLDGQPLEADDPLLLREVAVLADRHDITEELDRLDSHVEALGAALEGDGLAGKQLEFLLQEVGREVNTVGSKSADVGLTERVVAMKGCVERLREQAANIA